jgi:hypothetical protein
MIITPPLRTNAATLGIAWRALRRVEMHPNRRQHDLVELFTAGSHGRQIRQTIVDLFNQRRWMQDHRAAAKFYGRFNGND